MIPRSDDRGIIRVLDALIVVREDDRTFSGVDVANLDADSAGDLTVFAGANTGLLKLSSVIRNWPAASVSSMILAPLPLRCVSGLVDDMPAYLSAGASRGVVRLRQESSQQEREDQHHDRHPLEHPGDVLHRVHTLSLLVSRGAGFIQTG